MTRPHTTVLQSFKAPGPMTNPYTVQLHRALDGLDATTSLTFTWRRALLARYDVVHLHWPEALVARRRPASTLVRQLLWLLLLLRWRSAGTGVVRTVHNLELPSDLPRHQVRLLRLTERWTDVEVHLNDVTRSVPGRPSAVVPQGHYTDWYAEHPRPERVPGRVLFIGRIRRYKRADLVVRAFRELEDPSATLRVVGHPSSYALVEALQLEAAGDPRIDIDPTYVTDARFVHEVAQAQVVVLPYPDMHNSAAVLAALSIGTPVLVPDNEVNRRLGAEVGEGWVSRSTSLRGSDLARSLAGVPGGEPDLDSRGWIRVAHGHAEAYAAARDVAARRRGAHTRRRAAHSSALSDGG